MKKTINKKDLVIAIQRQMLEVYGIKMSRQQLSQVIDQLLDLIIENTVNDNPVTLSNFGSFRVGELSERIIKVPTPDGYKEVLAPKRKSVNFRASGYYRRELSRQRKSQKPQPTTVLPNPAIAA